MLLNVITMGQATSDNTNKMITLSKMTLLVFGCKNAQPTSKVFVIDIILTE
jgi:hypothetical protein